MASRTPGVFSADPAAIGSGPFKPLNPNPFQFSLKNILTVLQEVNFDKLPLLAVQLDLEKDLSYIERDHDQVSKRLAETWLKRHGRAASWEMLVSALRSRLVDEQRVATELETRFIRRDSGTSTLSSSGSEPYSPRSPISNLSDTTEEKVVNRMRVISEVHVRDSFGNLVSLLASKLSEKQSNNELDIKKFYLHLSNFFPPRALPSVVDILMIFQDINAQELWDYNQYDTIECLGKRYLPGDKELISAITEHKEMVHNFQVTHSIANYIEEKVKMQSESMPDTEFELRSLKKSFKGRRTSRNYYNRLAATLKDVSIRMKNLKYVRDLWRGIQREFHLPDCNALLDTIYEGSIIIEWLISPSASEAMLRPQPWTAIRFIQSALITNMLLNDNCVYDMEDSMHLLDLCSLGQFQEVDQLLRSKEKGAAVNATFEEVHEGKSALILVSEHGHISLVLTVLDGGADVNFQHQGTGQTALHFAAKCGHLRVTRFLLAYGADADIQDYAGTTASSAAGERGHTIVSEELRKGKSKSKIRTQNPIQHASDKIEEFTDFILKPGIKLYHRAAKSLVGASRSNHLDSVKYIIKNARNLDINAKESDKHGWTALMWATDKDNLEMVELLLANKADTNVPAKNNGWTAIMLATRQGNLRIVKILLDHGADPNAQNKKGTSSMSLAVYEHHTEIAMLLVHRGAYVNIVEEDGNSPLTHACVENDLELVQLFCDHNAELNHQGVKGWTPLMEAARKGYRDVVEELAKRGAELNLETEAGDSALHAATVKGHVEVVKVLATYGANLDMPNKDGLTALMVAADKGYLSIVEALLDGGANVNYKHQTTGWPAIFFAAKNGKVSTLRTLLERGAITELQTGMKLVDVASFFKKREIVEEIRKKPQVPQPQPTPSVRQPTEVAGTESGTAGIELKSFTKKDAAIGKVSEQEPESVTPPEASLDAPDQQPVVHEPPTNTKLVEAPTHVQRDVTVEKQEVKTEDTRPEEVDEKGSMGVEEGVGEDVLTHHSPSEEPHTEVKPEDATSTTKNEDATKIDDTSKSPDRASSNELEDTEDDLTTVKEDQAPDTQHAQPGDKDKPDTCSNMEENLKDDTNQSNQQDIAEIAKAYELLFKAIDERMNIENVKKSRRKGKGVADVHRLTQTDEIEQRS